jgi:signal transduction histidine kinase
MPCRVKSWSQVAMNQSSATPASVLSSPAVSGPAGPESEVAAVKAPSRRRMLLVYAAATLAQYALDVLAVGPDGRMLAVRIVWALGLVAGALLVNERFVLSVRVNLVAQSVLASMCFLALIHFSGDTASPYFQFYPFLPLLMAQVYPDGGIAPLVSGVLCCVGIAGLLILDGAPASEWLLWVGITLTSTLLAMYGTHQFRKVQRAETEARLERTRREALEKLAISERRRAQSEKLATIGQLLAGVMHEINNPVAFIQANLDFLEREVRSGPPVPGKELAQVVAETREGVARVQQIVADLKGFSHMDDEQPAECSLVDVVNEAARIASLRLKYVAQLEVEVSAQLPPVLVVRRRMAQVLLNLLVNAGDALEEHGAPGSKVHVIGRQEGARVLLLVEDNGPGFPPHVLPRLFEAFFTTKRPEKGTGLGLALARELVEQVGGCLVAENRKEGGARLRLELPCVPLPRGS